MYDVICNLQAEGVTYAGQRQAMRQRTYSVLSDIKTGHAFAPMVAPPSETHDGHPGITWEAFHKVRGSEIECQMSFCTHGGDAVQTHDGHPGITWEAFHKVASMSAGACMAGN